MLEKSLLRKLVTSSFSSSFFSPPPTLAFLLLFVFVRATRAHDTLATESLPSVFLLALNRRLSNCDGILLVSRFDFFPQRQYLIPKGKKTRKRETQHTGGGGGGGVGEEIPEDEEAGRDGTAVGLPAVWSNEP